MISAIKWFALTAVIGCFAMVHSSGQTTSWSITITKSFYETSCGGQKVSIPGASTCASAIIVAQGVFNSNSSCDPRAPDKLPLQELQPAYSHRRAFSWCQFPTPAGQQLFLHSSVMSPQ